MASLGALAALVLVRPSAGQSPTPPVAADSASCATGTAVDLHTPDDPWPASEIAPQCMNGTPAAPGTAKDGPAAQPAPAGGTLARRGARRSASSAGGEDAAPRAGQPSVSWVRTSLALGGVSALILLLGWGYRAVMTGGGKLPFAFRGRAAGVIEVVGRTTLSPRQSLCLVRIGPRMILLGLTHERVQALDVITDADLTARLIGQAAGKRSDSNSADFDRCLAGEAQLYDEPPTTIDEPAPPGDQRVIEIRHKLAGAVRRLRAAAGAT